MAFTDDVDEKYNNLLAAGAILAVLSNSDFGTIRTVEARSGRDGIVTNQIDIGFSFLQSTYRITVERVPD